MASKLDVDEIAAKNGTSPVTLTKQIASKAYVTKNQAGSAILESFGVSSISDDASGTHTINVTNSMSSSNYHVPCSVRETGARFVGQGSITASSIKVLTWNVSVALADIQVGSDFVGDLA